MLLSRSLVLIDVSITVNWKTSSSSLWVQADHMLSAQVTYLVKHF